MAKKRPGFDSRHEVKKGWKKAGATKKQIASRNAQRLLDRSQGIERVKTGPKKKK